MTFPTPLTLPPYLTRRSLDDHHGLYLRYVRELEDIKAKRKLVTWAKPPDSAPAFPSEVEAMLDRKIPDLDLTPAGVMQEMLAELKGELNARGITWLPSFVPGEDEFYTLDRATTISYPWYLANPTLWWLVNDRHLKYDREEVLRILRHETAHALGYAFEIWKRADWQDLFGDFNKAYRQGYTPDPESTDHVRHLHGSQAWQNSHYAQKHPDEDWAETFATWLTPGLAWQTEYPEGTKARAKLEYVDRLVNDVGALYGKPTNTWHGRHEGVPSGTVRDFLGLDEVSAYSEHAALARREPEVYAAVLLHELYFDQLSAKAMEIGPKMARAAKATYGSVEAWQMDLRAIAGTASPGWAVTAWSALDGGALKNFLVEDHARGLPADSRILLAIDCWEHAYQDTPGRRDIYLAGALRYLRWDLVDDRLAAVEG